MIICSQVHTTCMPPYPWPETFNNTYDCMTFGYKESLKKIQIKKVICTTCKGNGYLKIKTEHNIQETIHQCWVCDSEGELYEKSNDNLISDNPTYKLH